MKSMARPGAPHPSGNPPPEPIRSDGEVVVKWSQKQVLARIKGCKAELVPGGRPVMLRFHVQEDPTIRVNHVWRVATAEELEARQAAAEQPPLAAGTAPPAAGKAAPIAEAPAPEEASAPEEEEAAPEAQESATTPEAAAAGEGDEGAAAAEAGEGRRRFSVSHPMGGAYEGEYRLPRSYRKLLLIGKGRSGNPAPAGGGSHAGGGGAAAEAGGDGQPVGGGSEARSEAEGKLEGWEIIPLLQEMRGTIMNATVLVQRGKP
jgi:hypothetical protein